jgi:hypothetical protein
MDIVYHKLSCMRLFGMVYLNPLMTMQAEKLVWQELEEILLNYEFV